MFNDTVLTAEARRNVYMRGKAMGENLRQTATPLQAENIGYLLAISYHESEKNRDDAAEAYDQGRWHGFNDPLPVSVHIQNAGGKL